MVIELRHLSKTYRDANQDLTVISDLTFTFPAQGTVAIVGRSGSGKSTLLHLLGGLDAPSAGGVFFDNSNFSALSVDERAAVRAKRIGFVFQFHHLLPEFTALENVSMPLVIGGESERTAETAANELLAKVGLADRGHHRPSQLSGGEQQRVAIARALVARPQLVLADEPTGNLDIATAADVQKLLVDAGKEEGRLVIIVTHNLELASAMDHVLEMTPGGRLQSYSGSALHERTM